MLINQLLELQPGEDLDRIVAKYVFDNVVDNYSTEISSAWKVVDRVELLDCRWLNYFAGKWELHEMAHGEIDLTIVRGCDTAQEAICKAAVIIKIRNRLYETHRRIKS